MAIAVGTRPSWNGLHAAGQHPLHWERELGRILIAEDEPRISSFLERGLAANGYTTEVVDNGEAALALARSGRFDLLVLDIGLPDMDGFNVVRELRRGDSDIPVLALTARGTIRADDVACLSNGADDCLTKPFSFEELLARIQERLRRETPPGPVSIGAGDLTLDLLARRALVNGVPVDLSAREFAMAQVFVRHPGRILTREQLLERVWGYDYDPGSNIVDVYVGYLCASSGSTASRACAGWATGSSRTSRPPCVDRRDLHSREVADLLPTSVVGSYPQPGWLIDRDRLGERLPPRVRARSSGASPNRGSRRRRTTRRGSPSPIWSAPVSTS